MLDWLDDNQQILWWAAIASVVLFVGSLIVIPVLVVRIPPNYFRGERPPQVGWRRRHRALRLLLLVLKNVLGLALLLAGIAMLALPGQGLLTIFMGLMLLNFPGKRQMEQWLVRRPGVLRAINWLRERAHREPLEEPEIS